MSFRELRNFCEIMRALGYPRLISMENFRKPNFELVADILYWLANRYDPKAQISDDIEDQKSRVDFIKSIATLFATKANIRLNPKKLYQADGYACQEILKVATMLYKAYFWQKIDDEDRFQQNFLKQIFFIDTDFSLPSRFGNTKELKQNADEINKLGTHLFDLLNKENDVKQFREKAMSFLENLHSFDSKEGEQYIEKCVREIISSQEEQISQMSKYVRNLERDEKLIEEKIRKKQMDLERAEKRFQTLTNVKPAYMEEYERLEHELEKLFNTYIDKFRNLEYLEHELDQYNMEELEKFEQSRRKLEKWASILQKEEMDILTGKKEVDLKDVEKQIMEANDNEDSRPESQLDPKKKKEWTNAQKQMMHGNGFYGGAFSKEQRQQQQLQQEDDDEGELEVEGDDDEEEEGDDDEGIEVDGSGSGSDHNF